jgi:hypothetical protein
MNGARFGYCGFAPHSPTELAFVRAEENDALHERVETMLDKACKAALVAKDQKGPMQRDEETEKPTEAWRPEDLVDSAGPDEVV